MIKGKVLKLGSVALALSLLGACGEEEVTKEEPALSAEEEATAKEDIAEKKAQSDEAKRLAAEEAEEEAAKLKAEEEAKAKAEAEAEAKAKEEAERQAKISDSMMEQVNDFAETAIDHLNGASAIYEEIGADPMLVLNTDYVDNATETIQDYTDYLNGVELTPETEADEQLVQLYQEYRNLQVESNTLMQEGITNMDVNSITLADEYQWKASDKLNEMQAVMMGG